MQRFFAQAGVQIGDWPKVMISAARPKLARDAVRALIDDGAEILMSFGYAGGLEPGLDAGTIVIPKKIITPDGDALVVDEVARAALIAPRSSGAGRQLLVDGALAGSDEPVLTPDQKRNLHRRTNAIAVDMESHILARAAVAAGLPFVVLRAISDPASLSMPRQAISAIKENGHVDGSSIVRYLLTHPWQLPVFIKMGTGAAAANKALKNGLQALPDLTAR